LERETSHHCRSHPCRRLMRDHCPDRRSSTKSLFDRRQGHYVSLVIRKVEMLRGRVCRGFASEFAAKPAAKFPLNAFSELIELFIGFSIYSKDMQFYQKTMGTSACYHLTGQSQRIDHALLYITHDNMQCILRPNFCSKS
jgi:hypothetical protein